MRCLAKDADERPAGAAAFLDELQKLEDTMTWGPREAKKWWALHAELEGFSTTGGGEVRINVDTGTNGGRATALSPTAALDRKSAIPATVGASKSFRSGNSVSNV